MSGYELPSYTYRDHDGNLRIVPLTADDLAWHEHLRRKARVALLDQRKDDPSVEKPEFQPEPEVS